MRLGLGWKTPMALVLGMALLGACSDDDPVTPSNNPPTGLAAAASGSTGVNLTWTAATGVTQYVLARAQGAAGRPWPAALPGDGPAWRRSYWVVAAGGGTSAPPNQPKSQASRNRTTTAATAYQMRGSILSTKVPFGCVNSWGV